MCTNMQANNPKKLQHYFHFLRHIFSKYRRYRLLPYLHSGKLEYSSTLRFSELYFSTVDATPVHNIVTVYIE